MEINFELLQTERLLLRKISPKELNYFFENCSEETIRKELNILTDSQFAKEKEKFNKGYSDYRRSLLGFQLIDKTTREIIGNCGYHNWQAEHRRAEIGYDLAKDEFKRKGLMSEAMKAVIDYGFGSMKLIRIEACVSPNNEASLKLLQKFNFVKEGYLRQHYYKDGVMEDSLFFSLLKEEFTK
jgi:[ribosomal protein S5]-alanine N-acetyltransferase